MTLKRPNVRNENIHIFLPVIHHIAHAHAHLWKQQCGYTKQAVRSHSPTVHCGFNPNVITQVLSKERRVWVLIITLICERAGSIWGEGGSWARALLQRLMLKQLLWYYKKPSSCIMDILLCFCAVAKPLIHCFALCSNQLNVLKLSWEDKCASRNRVLGVGGFWQLWKACRWAQN